MPYIYDLTRLYFHERSYNENSTPSRPLWEVKSHLAWSVVRWVTTCEARVLFVLILFTLNIPFFCTLLSLITFSFIFPLLFHSISSLFHSILIFLHTDSNPRSFLSDNSIPSPSLSRNYRHEHSHRKTESSSLSQWREECGSKLCPINQKSQKAVGERKWNPSISEPWRDIKELWEEEVRSRLHIHWEERERETLSSLWITQHSSLTYSYESSLSSLRTWLRPKNFEKGQLCIHEGKVVFKWIPYWLSCLQFDRSLRLFLLFSCLGWRKRRRKVNRMIITC